MYTIHIPSCFIKALENSCVCTVMITLSLLLQNNPINHFFEKKNPDNGDLIGPHFAEGSNQTCHFLLLDLNKELYR